MLLLPYAENIHPGFRPNASFLIMPSQECRPRNPEIGHRALSASVQAQGRGPWPHSSPRSHNRALYSTFVASRMSRLDWSGLPGADGRGSNEFEHKQRPWLSHWCSGIKGPLQSTSHEQSKVLCRVASSHVAGMLLLVTLGVIGTFCYRVSGSRVTLPARRRQVHIQHMHVCLFRGQADLPTMCTVSLCT